MADVIPALNLPYITIQQIRDAGIPITEADDPTVQASIDLWMDQVDRWTGQWFNARQYTITIEGRNSNLIAIGIPIIEVTRIQLNHFLPRDAGEIFNDLSNFQIFVGRAWPDDRRNPRITIVANRSSIFGNFGRAFVRGLFTDIDGTYGFIEIDGTTPKPIQRAMTKLVLRDLKNPLLGQVSGGGLITGSKKREETDLHEIEFYQPSEEQANSSVKSLTGDSEVDKILAYYRKPISIGGSINAIPRIDGGTV